jgi:carboxymethylenebutenolidase
MDGTALSEKQAAMLATWERHMEAEFELKDIDATMATMTAAPFVNHVPTMTGGVGYEDVRSFYRDYFLTGHADDTEVTPVKRTIGADSIVDEVTYKFTHTIEMPWMLPGVAPTGKHAEVAIAAVVLFEGDRIAGERIYWDQASVLAQLGLLDANALPVTGIEASRKAADASREASNRLIERALRRKAA